MDKKVLMQLRQETQCSLADIKKALDENNWNPEEALKTLRILNKTKADKFSGKEAAEGKIGYYIHAGNKLAVLVEVNCQTDFAANSQEFMEFCNDVAMQIAALDPKYTSENDISEKDLEDTKEIFKKQSEKLTGKAFDRAVEGKVKKWKSEVCLLNQRFVKDHTKTIDEHREDLVAKLKENVQIKRWIRWHLG